MENMKKLKYLAFAAPILALCLTSCREAISFMSEIEHTQLDENAKIEYTTEISETLITESFDTFWRSCHLDVDTNGKEILPGSLKSVSETTFNDKDKTINYRKIEERYHEFDGQHSRYSSKSQTESSLLYTKSVTVEQDVYTDVSDTNKYQAWVTISVDDNVNYKISKKYINEEITNESNPKLLKDNTLDTQLCEQVCYL